MNFQEFMERLFPRTIFPRTICACHEDCLKPGNPRRPDCRGENRSGCANCRCFGLTSEQDWKTLAKERQFDPRLP